MQPSKRISLGAIIFIVLVVTFSIGFYVGNSGEEKGKITVSLSGISNTDNKNVDFGAFWKVWNILNEKFAGTTTPDQEKIWGAIKGLTASENDPYTVFFPPRETRMFKDEIAGNFEGVGMEVGLDKDGGIAVVTPLKDTPAEKAGLKPKDKILKIDNTSTEGLALDQAIGLIRGKSGTQVVLTIARNGTKSPFEIKVTRAVIDIPTIKTETKNNTNSSSTSSGSKNGGNASTSTSGAGSKNAGLREDGIFVISLYSFSANSANLFRNALKEFSDSGSHKLILDLRSNPGGYLEAAVDMASWFLPSGKIVVKEETGKEKEESAYRSKGYNIFNNKLKMVILVNGGSASASEILAGALSEHGVAALVGEKTFGKGSVQELVTITPETSLKVTIANWFTPNGVSISKQGIVPQYVVPFTEKDAVGKRDPQMDKAVELLSKEK